MHWIVAKTKSRQETWACKNIEQQGHQTYFPTAYTDDGQVKPLFGGYVFVLTNGAWYFLLGTYGVLGVLLQDGVPERVRGKEIGRLKNIAGADGVIRLPPAFEFNQLVRLLSGPFRDHVGCYQGPGTKGDHLVAVNVLGRSVPVPVAWRHLEAA